LGPSVGNFDRFWSWPPLWDRRPHNRKKDDTAGEGVHPGMRSSRTISLFSERPEFAQQSSSFVVSVFVHIAATSVLSYGIMSTPVTTDPVSTQHYQVRHLDLHTPEPKQAASSEGGKHIPYPVPQAVKQAAAAGGDPVPHEAALRQTVDAEPGPQTLIQPDIPHTAHLKEAVPLPTVVIWAPKKQVVKNIVAPLPEPATASDVKPSLQAPNEEVNLTDLSIAASDTPSKLQVLPPSTTSPLVVHGPEKAQLPPVTASQTSSTPTPAAVMSLSDLKMKDGPVTLPPVNETAIKKQSGPLAEGKAEVPSAPGKGNPESTAGGTGPGTGATAAAAVTTTDVVAKVSAPTKLADAKPAVAPAQSPETQAGAQTYPAAGNPEGAAGSDPPTSHFALPKDGEFGAVVVGATMQGDYPEVATVWGGRMAYTVYLHVGLEKSWTLQYSIPQAVETEAGGNTPRLEAPWPFNIVRPNLAAGAINADALMVHGFVNEAGRFESLAVAFPPEFPQAQYVLNALAQWQFRPAAENGRPARVEVVLIIPEVSN
jgi:hypothetical protein